jgi:hypothetical protein
MERMRIINGAQLEIIGFEIDETFVKVTLSIIVGKVATK